MRKSLIPTLLATALVCSPLAFAAGAPPATSASTGAAHHTRHHDKRTMSVLDQLDLTDTQRTNIKQLLRQSFEQSRPEMMALRQKQMTFEKATPGSGDFQTATNDLAQAESNAAHARVLREADVRTKIYGMLTPTQRTKLASIRAQRETQMKQWRESHQHTKNAPASSSR